MKKHGFLKGAWCRKACLLVMLIMLMSAILITPASAASLQKEAYDTYTYWTAPGTQQPSYTAPMYEYETTITGGDLGITGFNAPSDVFVDKNNLIYLTDKQNGRVVIINPDYTLNSVIQNIQYNGETLDTIGINATFVDKNGDIYIADTNNGRVIVLNSAKQVKKMLLLPKDDVIPADFEYKPEKIAIDSNGYIYVLSNGSYYGAVLYKPDGSFSSFYGANTVTGSILDVFDRLIDMLFVTEDQEETKETELPFCFTDIAIDEVDFVYTATAPSEKNATDTGQIKKLSPGGTNVLKNKTSSTVESAEGFNFSDGRGMKYAAGTQYMAWRSGNLCSMDVDSMGYMYGLCQTYGHIFIYDQECNRLSVFGGGLSAGTQKGTFNKPVNIQINDNNNDVLVVDEVGNSVTIFKETEYGALVKKAQQLTNNGDYVEAKEYWQKALTCDRNLQLAYRGLARAALIEEDYETTLHYAKLGFDQDTYSAAYGFVRNDYLTENFVWIFLLAVAVIAGVIAVGVYCKKKEKKLITNPKVATMFSCVVHPFEGAKQVRYYNQGSARLATVVLVIYFIVSILSDIYTGFMYNMLDKGSYSAAFTVVRTVGLVLLWSAVNWGLTTLFQGKGTMKQVYMVTCYALIPLIIECILNTILSNVLTPEEALVMSAISVVCLALAAIMLCVGIMTVHEFGFFKFIVMTLVIILGMLICVFVIMMVFVLIQQLFTFVGTLINEVTYR